MDVKVGPVLLQNKWKIERLVSGVVPRDNLCFVGWNLIYSAWGAKKRPCNFWISFERVSICTFIHTIKWPCVLYWLCCKSVKYLYTHTHTHTYIYIYIYIYTYIYWMNELRTCVLWVFTAIALDSYCLDIIVAFTLILTGGDWQYDVFIAIKWAFTYCYYVRLCADVPL